MSPADLPLCFSLFFHLLIEVSVPDRIIYRIDHNIDGPLILVIAALHGNEWVGIEALRELQSRLQKQAFAGRLVGIVGNLQAASLRKRFVEQDLNRLFRSDYLDTDHSDVAEWHQARALIETINTEIERYPSARGVHMLDIHSMSGDGIPFTCFPHTERNEQLAHQLPLPAIADLVEHLPGTLTEFYKHRMQSTMVVECGQHDAQSTLQTGIAALLYHLSLTGNLPTDAVDDTQLNWLLEHCGDMPRVFTRIRYRHAIALGSGFRMEPGYDNLQSVAQGELLATELGGEVYAPCSGRIALPCYQEQGEDGFFIAVDE